MRPAPRPLPPEPPPPLRRTVHPSPAPSVAVVASQPQRKLQVHFTKVASPTLFSTKIVEMWSGVLSLSLGLTDLSSQQHDVSLLAFSEKCELKRAYSRLLSPGAIDIGAFSEDMHAAMHGADVLFAGFHCEPYLKCGLQKREADPRSDSVLQTVRVQAALNLHLAVWENVCEFFKDDCIHGLLTEAAVQLEGRMVMHPVLFVYDTQLGGPLCRPRGFAIWESVDMYHRLPPWVIKPQYRPASSPAISLLPSDQVCDSLWVEGRVVLRNNTDWPSTDTPRVVAQVWFPCKGSSPVVGAAYSLRGKLFVIESISAQGRCRMMARERFNPASNQPRRNHETSAQVSFLCTQEVVPQPYPVYDPQYALLSLRSWGQQPVGNHCLVLQQLHGVPRARRTHSTEQLRWMKSSWTAAKFDAGLALMSSAGFTPDDVSRAAGASVTSPQ